MATPCVKGAMKLSEALDSMQLAYNPITKQLHFVSPRTDKKSPEEAESGGLSKKGSFSDEGISVSTCEKSDTSDSPKSTLMWSGHCRGKDGGSFSSTVSSLSEYSLSGGYASKDEDDTAATERAERTPDDSNKFKKKGLSGFFSRGVFPWKSSGGGSVTTKSQERQEPPAGATSWRLFSSKSSTNLPCAADPPSDPQPPPASSGAATPRHHARQGSSASEKQFQDLVASSIALIQHDRPSNLPAKCGSEAARHRAEHARLMEAARRRAEREAAARRARQHEALRQEEALARSTREWAAVVLPDWENTKSSKRTLELWWSGLPPSIRGKVWLLSIDNKLDITVDMYHECVARAKSKLREAQQRRRRLKINNNQCCKEKTRKDETRISDDEKTESTDKTEAERKAEEASDRIRDSTEAKKTLHRNLSEQNLKSRVTDTAPATACVKNCRSDPSLLDCGGGDECSVELIQLDIARTFPHLCIFQPGGPYFDMLHELLSAYVCLRPDIGYVQGMSFLGAMLILNMDAPQAFICFTNLLDGPVLKAAYTRDGLTMQKLWSAYSQLLQWNVPCLASRLAPELYLLEWLYTAFAKAMPLDTACRVWDLFLRDGDTFLFRTALGVLHLYQDILKDMDFISAAQFLTKLPEDLDSDALFRSISAVTMTLNGLSFDQLVSASTVDEQLADLSERL